MIVLFSFQPFVPPPHFRRWMQKFMNRWHKRNAPGCSSGDEAQKGEKAEKMEEEGGKQEECNGEEFLRNVGECVANMLDPFGEFSFYLNKKTLFCQLTCDQLA